MNATLEAALGYARLGLAVLPCKPGGKEPLTPNGVKDATTDEATIRGWWERWANANVAIAVPAGVVVVDVDGPEGWAALKAEGLTLPTTLTAITGRGEWHRHLWYWLPEGVTVRNAVGILHHVDVRTVRGYVVAPPSVTVGPYRWLTPGAGSRP